MSYAISMTIQTQLRKDRPAWVTEYLQSIVSKDPAAGHGPNLAKGAPHYRWAEYLPERDWFTAVPCGLAAGLTSDTERFWLASDFHDDFAQHDQFLMELIATYTAGDRIIGRSGTTCRRPSSRSTPPSAESCTCSPSMAGGARRTASRNSRERQALLR